MMKYEKRTLTKEKLKYTCYLVAKIFVQFVCHIISFLSHKTFFSPLIYHHILISGVGKVENVKWLLFSYNYFIQFQICI